MIPFGPINGNDVDSPYEHPSQTKNTAGFDPLPAFGTSNIINTFGNGWAAAPTIAEAPGPPDNPDLPQIKTPQTLAGPDGLVLFMQLSIRTTTNGLPQDDPNAIFSRIFGILNVGVREKIGGENTFREIRGIKFDFAVGEQVPPCPWDLNGDGFVGVGDMLAIFSLWGPCPGPPGCPGDFNDDGFVGFGDQLIMFANWGPCG